MNLIFNAKAQRGKGAKEFNGLADGLKPRQSVSANFWTLEFNFFKTRPASLLLCAFALNSGFPRLTHATP